METYKKLTKFQLVLYTIIFEKSTLERKMREISQIISKIDGGG